MLMFPLGIGESTVSISPRWNTRTTVLLSLDPRKDQVLSTVDSSPLRCGESPTIVYTMS
jgi:hypothetical protein